MQCIKKHENADEYVRNVLLLHTVRICWFTIQSGSLIRKKKKSSQTFEHNGYTGRWVVEIVADKIKIASRWFAYINI